MTRFAFEPIGCIRSCFPEKFGIPRQPGLVPEAHAILEIIAPYDQREAFRGLTAFSHLWLLFVFHACYGRPWRATVRPPRLGGNRRIGVFASRSGFRPNAIGQSVVSLIGIKRESRRLQIELGGIDLLDGTPVLDIKPYLPYSDAIPEATAGYAPAAPPARQIRFSEKADLACERLDPVRYPDLKALIMGLLAQDPRPAYKEDNDSRIYGMRLWDLNVRFQYRQGRITVSDIERLTS